MVAPARGPVTAQPQRAAPSVPATGPARRHPDRKTAWVIVLLARSREGAVPPPEVLEERLARATREFPLISSRLTSGHWVHAGPPRVSVAGADADPLAIAPVGHFDLRHESPLRIVTSQSNWVLLCAHHFAFDGLGMVSLLRSLLDGASAAAPDYVTRSSPRRPPTDALRRLFRYADPVAPSEWPAPADSFAATKVQVSGPHITAQIARASVLAVGDHNAERGYPLRRAGLSIAIGGVRGEAATYRRVDLRPDQDLEAEVVAAMSESAVPTELAGLPPGAFLLRPLLRRLSDTVLVSNLGRQTLEGIDDLQFYPVARGRSAVAVGAVGRVAGPTTLTLRARDLTPPDATALLERIAERLGTPTASEPAHSAIRAHATDRLAAPPEGFEPSHTV